MPAIKSSMIDVQLRVVGVWIAKSASERIRGTSFGDVPASRQLFHSNLQRRPARLSDKRGTWEQFLRQPLLSGMTHYGICLGF